jgi:hypothetical protein
MKPWSEALRPLPDFAPPPGGWLDLQRRRRRQAQRRVALGGGLALAASLLLALGLRPTPDVTPAAEPAEIAQLIQRSRELEQTLAALRPRARGWNETLASTAALLQDELAVVDLQLNYADAGGATRLWQDRVALMNQLVHTHQSAAAAARNPSTEPAEEFAI